MKIGDKILVEVTVRELEPIMVSFVDMEDEDDWVPVYESEIRPWTEKPVTVLWTDPEGYKVLSNGSVQSHSSDLLANDFKSSAVLAAYVRHLGAK